MSATRTIRPTSYVFTDDGLVPNNPLPMLTYRRAIEFGSSSSPEETVEALFQANGWGGTWRNGVYDFPHFHATVHEALGVARGRARVQFGGDRGAAVEIAAGDAVILPAGTGHQCLSASDDFVVVGAYPPGPAMQVTRLTPENHKAALRTIPKVPLPDTDPLFGAAGPLVELWRRNY